LWNVRFLPVAQLLNNATGGLSTHLSLLAMSPAKSLLNVQTETAAKMETLFVIAYAGIGLFAAAFWIWLGITFSPCAVSKALHPRWYISSPTDWSPFA
jgi:hypothetical protein